MVQTTIVRTPNAFARQAPPRRELRRPPLQERGNERGPARSFEERGSLAGTLLLIVLALAVISWVLTGAA